MLLVYSSITTSRLKYTLDLIFQNILKISYKITNNKEEFSSFNGAKINYSEYPISDELFIYADRLLFEKGIKDKEINVFTWEDMPVLFATHPKYIIPFDPFAASFYLVSRYEEYLPHIKDEFERFHADQSIAFQKGFLQKPLVNIWAKKIKALIQEKYPSLKFPKQNFKYLSTIDIDNAYAYKEKGLMRTCGAYFKALFNFEFKEIVERTRVLLGVEQDPFDTYDIQLDILKRYNLKSIYFILIGEYGENDKNISRENRRFQSLIKSIADYAEIGIHPSYASNEDTGKLKNEIERLSRILKREVTKSRQHFLKLSLPNTYRQLIDLDITNDYTMGYTTQIGFRASICTSFYYYDLDLDMSTKLKIHPFSVMDATLKYYMKIEAHHAINYIKPLIDEVKKVDGTFISLWHNDSLSNVSHWRGWKEVYENMVKEALN